MIKGLGPTLPEAVDHVLSQHGVQRIRPSMAGRGDLVLVRSGRGHEAALGVHAGHAIAALSERGFAWFPISAALIAWRI